MTEVAKLTERIDNLIERVAELKNDGKDTSSKLIDIEKSISFVRGAIWVLGGFFALALIVIGVVLTKILGT